MFYEKLGFDININQLRKDIEKYVFTAGDQFIQGEDYDNFYSSWCVAQDGKIIVAKFDVESKHSVVEKSG